MTSNDPTTGLPRHPVTGLRALDVLPSGRVVWPVLGGDGNGDGGDGQGGTANAGQNGAQGGDGGEPGTGTQGTDGEEQDGNGDQVGADDLANLDPAALADMVRKLRRENGSARTNAKQTAAAEAESAIVQKLGRTLGLIKDDADGLTPEQLTEQLTAAQAEAATLRTERAAERAARKAGLDADALLDSRSFAKKLDALDSQSDDFATALDALVGEYADDSRYKAGGQAPTPSRSGGDFSGGSGDAANTDLGRLSVEDYINKTRKKKG